MDWYSEWSLGGIGPAVVQLSVEERMRKRNRIFQMHFTLLWGEAMLGASGAMAVILIPALFNTGYG